MHGLLAALWQADTAFPSGGFAFSNGVEGVAALSDGLDARGLAALVAVHLRHRWATADRVALVRAHRAADDLDRLAAIDAALEAAVLVEALRTGSRRQGAALAAAHARLRTPGAAELRDAVRAGRLGGHLAVVQGALWRACGLDEATAVAVSAYLAVQGLASVAVRLGGVGAIEAQGVVAAALQEAATLAAAPVEDADEIAGFTPFLDVAAALHASADVRLFAN